MAELGKYLSYVAALVAAEVIRSWATSELEKEGNQHNDRKIQEKNA